MEYQLFMVRGQIDPCAGRWCSTIGLVSPRCFAFCSKVVGLGHVPAFGRIAAPSCGITIGLSRWFGQRSMSVGVSLLDVRGPLFFSASYEKKLSTPLIRLLHPNNYFSQVGNYAAPRPVPLS